MFDKFMDNFCQLYFKFVAAFSVVLVLWALNFLTGVWQW